MAHPLDGAWAKLRQAERHIETFDGEFAQWRDKRKGEQTFTVGKEFDDQNDCFLWYVKDVQPLPLDWGLTLGDALSNFRSTLDYVAWELVRHGNDPNPKNPTQIQFPIYLTPKDFDDNLGRRIPGVPSAQVAIIRRAQPYARTDPPKLDCLARLDKLLRDNKHRELKQTLPQSALDHIKIPHSPPGFLVERVEVIYEAGQPLEAHTKLLRVCGSKRGDAEPDVKVEFEGTAAVAFDDGGLVGETLDTIGGRVTALLSEFEPLLKPT